MLPPDHRHVLLDILRPPAGHRLSGAVGTTFTLSLDAALVVPLAFASFRLSGSSDPVAVMEAVRAAADRVDVFCQAGQMSVPRQASGLFAFLEPMVHEVRRPAPGRLFHPKVWFLRYVDDDGSAALRFVCLTRNLTDDSSWDIALRLDGTEQRRPRASNRPLSDFLLSLADMAVHPLHPERRGRVAELGESARRAQWEWPEQVTQEPRFWPLGLPTVKARPDLTGYRHLVVAPFLNDAGLATVAPGDRSEVTVISRAEDLDRLGPAALDRVATSFVVSPAADLGDPDAPAVAPGRDGLFGLHAKLLIIERNRAAHVFIGSANATNAAFGGNVEFLVELVGGATKFGVQRFLDHEEGLGSILEPYTPAGGADPDPIDEALRRLRDVLRSVAEQPFTATVTADGDRYLEHIQAPHLGVEAGIDLRLELVTAPGHAARLKRAKPVDVVLGPVELDQVTPFVVVHASCTTAGGEQLHQATVIRCELIDEPADRLDEILARQVDTPEKFIRFLLLVLGISAPPLGHIDGGSGGKGSWIGGRPTNGIFELLARAVADRPDVLEDLGRLIPRLRATSSGAAVLPPGFDALWDVIQAARPALLELRKATER